jgi:hypothetical protein
MSFLFKAMVMFDWYLHGQRTKLKRLPEHYKAQTIFQNIVSPTIYGFWLSFGILWPWHCLSYYLRLLVLLVSCGHCIVSPTIYGFWFFWYLVAMASRK